MEQGADEDTGKLLAKDTFAKCMMETLAKTLDQTCS